MSVVYPSSFRQMSLNPYPILDPGESKGSGRCKAPVECEELLGHGRETEPFVALARQAPHLVSRGTFQAGEPVCELIDGESVYHISVHSLLDQFFRAALRGRIQRRPAIHFLNRPNGLSTLQNRPA